MNQETTFGTEFLATTELPAFGGHKGVPCKGEGMLGYWCPDWPTKKGGGSGKGGTLLG